MPIVFTFDDLEGPKEEVLGLLVSAQIVKGKAQLLA
jgi:hypothetical protein